MFQHVHSTQSTLFQVGQFDAEAFSCLGSEKGAPFCLPKQDGSVASRVFSQEFTQKLEVFFPVGDVGIGYKLAPIMEPRSKHFYAAKQSPMDFTSPQFKTFLDDLGALFALSIGRRIDVDDIYAVYPNGELGMSLTKDTLFTTGFATNNKVMSHRKRTQSPAYSEIAPSYASIDLKSKKQQKQAEFALHSRLIPPTHFFISWEPKSLATGTQRDVALATTEESAEKLFSSFTRLLINSERKTLRGLQVPIISISDLVQEQDISLTSNAKPEPRSFSRLSNHGLSQTASEGPKIRKHVVNELFAEEIIEWIGAMHCRVRNYIEGGEIDPSISLVTPSCSIEKAPMHGLVFCHEGFLNPLWVLHQIKQAKAIVDAGHAPYAVLTAWAFVDQPLHTGLHINDAHYTIVILTDDRFIWIAPTQL